ncbi:hypothetical protein ABER02_20585 [Rossellomorea marisflavi]|uniref:hypothetical protein n=1 Tax=Rossellomorea marisflavi TaxID=189381 RepID=UPI003D2B120C
MKTGSSLSAAGKSSFLGCACGISTFPLFPQESSPFRSNTLCDLYVVGMNSPWAVESFRLNKQA